jgi:two-component system, NtrC family, sensor kinase
MKLQTKTNVAIVAVFLTLAVITTVLTLQWHNSYAIKAAENRVGLYIRAAWEIYGSKTERIHGVLRVLAEDEKVEALLTRGADGSTVRMLQEELHSILLDQNMDVLNVIDASGRVMLRANPASDRGDSLADDPMVAKVLQEGSNSSGTVSLSRERLLREGESLVERCEQFGGEPRGMMAGASVPVFSAGRLAGVLQMGNLLNGAVEKVDRIRDSVFANEQYAGKPLGTATIFMEDLRISTNVLNQDGSRAIGTRVSEEVADHVLGQGRSWIGRAWVVNDWYLSRYDPIVAPDGSVVGILYIGELEQKYLDMRSRAVAVNLAVVLGGMLLAMVVFFLVIRTILSPIERLHAATKRLSDGDLTHRVEVGSEDEIGELAKSFNQMAEQLLKDQQEIEKSQGELKKSNRDQKVVNRNYMEMLGFVSHELKTPLGSAILGLYSVKDGYLGQLNETQHRVLGSVADSLEFFNEMIKHYLDLSRVEKGELKVNKRMVNLLNDVVRPVTEGMQSALKNKGMTIHNCLTSRMEVDADRDLLRIVYDNLLSNAIKYGRESGVIRLEAQPSNGDMVLGVYNEGEGVPPGKMCMLFRKFSRIDNPKHAGMKGTGLGLYICKEIIERHGGRIWAESRAGEWIKFSFTLPNQKDGAIHESKETDFGG